MKKKSVLVLVLALFFCLFSYAKKTEQLPSTMVEFKADKINKELGYQLIDDGKKVVFVFDASKYKIKAPQEVFVEGSFNGWSKGKDENWLMKMGKDKLWTLTKDVSEVNIPGNSGFPEFKFFVKAEVEKTIQNGDEQIKKKKIETIEPSAISKKPGFQMASNNLILFLGDDPNVVVENKKTAETEKKLAEFDLSKTEDIAMISNFRQVPEATKLFRGYHPYKASRNQYDTEKTRISLVQKLLEDNKVQSIITLSGDEKVSGTETVSAYIKDLDNKGNHLFIDTSYNVVYYHSNEDTFAQVMIDIISFINSHPGPYYVHCRLGTDRTGVTSAVLAALAGASWDQIRTDYQKTNAMGIKEFRDYRLLQYSFEHMLGKKISDINNLQKEVSENFISRNIATQKDLDKLASRLK